MDGKTRQNQYHTLPEEMRTLYASDDLSIKIKFLSEQYQVIDLGKLLDTIGDTILGFHKTGELPDLLQKEVGVSADTAQRITAELLEFLSPVIARESNEQNVKKNDISRLTEAIAQSGKTAAPETAAVTTPVSGEREDVKPLRTMSDDMNRVHGYGAYRAQNPLPPEEQVVQSTQYDTLTQPTASKPVTETPKYTEEG